MSERLNVKNMMTEAEKPDSSFHPSRDITPAMWESMDVQLEDFAAHDQWVFYLLLASHEAILGKQPFIPSEHWPKIMKRYKGFTRSRWDSFLENIACLAILGNPQVLSDDQWEGLLSRIHQVGKDSEWDWYFSKVAEVAIADHEPSIPKSYYGFAEQEMNSFSQAGEWSEFVRMAADLTILGHKPIISSEIWQEIRVWFREISSHPIKENTWDKIAVSLAINSADRVIIPQGGGLKLEWDSKPDSLELPELPQTRTF